MSEPAATAIYSASVRPTAVMRRTKILLCQIDFSPPMSPACFQDARARLKQVCNYQARDMVSEVQGQAPALCQTQ